MFKTRFAGVLLAFLFCCGSSVAVRSVADGASVASTQENELSTTELHVIPGDTSVYGDLVIEWERFAEVTETHKNDRTILSGNWRTGETWEFSFDEDGDIKSSSSVPLTYHNDGIAIALPEACHYGEITIDGWTFMAEGRVRYNRAKNVSYVYGDDWNAMILDYSSYMDWQDFGRYDQLMEPMAYDLAVHDGKSWVLVSSGAPRVISEDNEGVIDEIDELVDKLKNIQPMADKSDPKWGGTIDWNEHMREEKIDAENSTFWLESAIGERQFKLEIKDKPSAEACEYFKWSGALMPANYIAQESVSVLHYEHFVITVKNDVVEVLDTITGERRSFTIADDVSMRSKVMVFIASDGRNAQCISCRPEYIAMMYAIDN